MGPNFEIAISLSCFCIYLFYLTMLLIQTSSRNVWLLLYSKFVFYKLNVNLKLICTVLKQCYCILVYIVYLKLRNCSSPHFHMKVLSNYCCFSCQDYSSSSYVFLEYHNITCVQCTCVIILTPHFLM